MQQYRNLILGFVLIISLMTGLGVFSLYHLNNISKDVDNIYKHPFAVSNAGQAIQTLIFAMHRDMKDVVLTKDREKLQEILNQIDRQEQKVHSEFDIIFERFLGNKSQIKQTYQTFIEWKSIRDEVVRLKLQGQNDEAVDITRGQGARHVDQLLAEVHEFVLFARKKADEFHKQADANKEHSILVVGAITLITLVVGALIAINVMRRIRSANKEIAQREHLVDQNIMLASLDKDGTIIEASNALCRFLGKTKKDVVGTQSHFFDNSDNARLLEEQIWKTINTGKAWQGEIKRINDDNLAQWANSTVLPVMDEHFQITGFTNLLQNATNKKLSITDKLTTLPNRRSFEEILDREIQVSHRHNTPLTLAILDVDFFKLYNDTYGHPQGDKALRQVADCIAENLRRPTDYAFRIGGEEFAIIISDQDLQKSRQFLEHIRSQVEQLAIPHESSRVAECVTISLGAYWTDGSCDTDKGMLYGEADKSLYLAKNNRNQLVISSKEIDGPALLETA